VAAVLRQSHSITINLNLLFKHMFGVTSMYDPHIIILEMFRDNVYKISLNLRLDALVLEPINFTL